MPEVVLRQWDNIKMNNFWKQFIRNMIIGAVYAALWYYVFYRIFDSFWLPTILTNIIGFFVGRYWIFKEGTK